MNSEIEFREHAVTRVIVLCNHAALFTNMYAIFIRYIVQSLSTKPTDAVGEHHVALHFTNAEPAVATPSFSGLSSQIHHGSDRPTVLLVVDHVFESLVENGTDENIGIKLLAGQAVIQDIVSVTLVPQILQLFGDGFHVEVAETGSVSEQSKMHQDLSEKGFFELADGHSTRDRVGINNNVGAQTVSGVRHVALGDDETGGSFLACL